MKDEIWTMKDGTKIAVNDMSEGHVRNALRMVIRNHRKLQLKLRQAAMLDRVMRAGRHAESDLDLEMTVGEMTVGEMQDELSAQSYRQLSNPEAFFPLLEGGRHGSPELAARYDPRGK